MNTGGFIRLRKYLSLMKKKPSGGFFDSNFNKALAAYAAWRIAQIHDREERAKRYSRPSILHPNNGKQQHDSLTHHYEEASPSVWPDDVAPYANDWDMDDLGMDDLGMDDFEDGGSDFIYDDTCYSDCGNAPCSDENNDIFFGSADDESGIDGDNDIFFGSADDDASNNDIPSHTSFLHEGNGLAGSHSDDDDDIFFDNTNDTDRP